MNEYERLANELNTYIDHVSEILSNENYRKNDIKNFLNAIHATAYDIGVVSERLKQKGELENADEF